MNSIYHLVRITTSLGPTDAYVNILSATEDSALRKKHSKIRAAQMFSENICIVNPEGDVITEDDVSIIELVPKE